MPAPWCYVYVSDSELGDYITQQCCDIPICQPVLGLHNSSSAGKFVIRMVNPCSKHDFWHLNYELYNVLVVTCNIFTCLRHEHIWEM